MTVFWQYDLSIAGRESCQKEWNERHLTIPVKITPFPFFLSPATPSNISVLLSQIITKYPTLLPYEWQIIQLNGLEIQLMKTNDVDTLIAEWDEYPLTMKLRQIPKKYGICVTERVPRLGLKAVSIGNCLKIEFSPESMDVTGMTEDIRILMNGGQNIIESINDNDTTERAKIDIQEEMKNIQFPLTIGVVYIPYMGTSFRPGFELRKKLRSTFDPAAVYVAATRRKSSQSYIDTSQLSATFGRLRPSKKSSSVPFKRKTPDIIEIDSNSEDDEKQPLENKPEENDECSIVNMDSKPLILRLTVGTMVRTPYGDGVIAGYYSYCEIPFYHIKFSYGRASLRTDQTTDISHKHLCRYQCEKTTIQFTYNDLGRLIEGEYLNDSIIEFYMTKILYEAPPHVATQIYVYSSFFYKQYTDNLQRITNRKEPAKNKREKAFQSVSSWTRGVNIFEKSMVMIPINDHCHWSLAIVCNLNQFLKPSMDEKYKPCFIMLDSMKCHRTQKITGNIRLYLQNMWDTQYQHTFGERTFNAELLPSITPPSIPRQKNYCDCGVFVLQYAELVMKNVPIMIDEEFLKYKGKAEHSIFTSKWFFPQEIPQKRQVLRQLLLELRPKSAISLD